MRLSLSAGLFSLAARNRFFLGPSKKKWVRELPDQGRLSLQTISFLRKRNGPHPKEKLGRGRAEYSYFRRRKILLSLGSTTSGRYALRLSAFGADMFPSGGACVFRLGRAPRRGPDAPRKHHSLPPQAGRRTARFFTSFPGAGSRRVLPQVFERAFFFGSPKPFLFGPVQKEMGSGIFLICP